MAYDQTCIEIYLPTQSGQVPHRDNADYLPRDRADECGSRHFLHQEVTALSARDFSSCTLLSLYLPYSKSCPPHQASALLLDSPSRQMVDLRRKGWMVISLGHSVRRRSKRRLGNGGRVKRGDSTKRERLEEEEGLISAKR